MCLQRQITIVAVLKASQMIILRLPLLTVNPAVRACDGIGKGERVTILLKSAITSALC